MTGRSTTGVQISAHRFLLRRLEHALVRGDVRMIDDPLRAQAFSLLAGSILAVVGLGVAAVLAFLQPRGALGDDPIVMVRDSGALYVRVDRTLHPVPNLASARLVSGSPAKPRLVNGHRTQAPRGGRFLFGPKRCIPRRRPTAAAGRGTAPLPAGPMAPIASAPVAAMPFEGRALTVVRGARPPAESGTPFGRRGRHARRRQRTRPGGVASPDRRQPLLRHRSPGHRSDRAVTECAGDGPGRRSRASRPPVPAGASDTGSGGGPRFAAGTESPCDCHQLLRERS